MCVACVASVSVVEAFFAFWPRKNWGEQKIELAPIFARPKSENASNGREKPTETLATQARDCVALLC